MPEQLTTMSIFDGDKQDFDRLKARHYLKHKLESMPTDATFFKILVRTFKEE